MTDWKKRYVSVYNEHQLREYPSASTTFGYLPPKYPDISKHNGLRKFVVDFLKFSGHHAEVVNNIGRPVQKFIPRFNIHSGQVEEIKGGIEWQKGSGKNGTSDIHSHIQVEGSKYPVPVYIEIKVGRDWQRDEQIEFEKLVTDTGAIYIIIRSPEQFLQWYDQFLLSLK